MSLKILSKEFLHYCRLSGISAHANCQKHLSISSARLAEDSSTAKRKKRMFSGIQPTGLPHIGNYLSAIKQWVEAQDDNQLILSIVDLHAVTIPRDPVILRSDIRNMAAALLACGIDPKKTILFQQSQVSEHAELGWLLGCLTTMPRLQALPQWKEKSDTMKETPLGLFTYPVLQAADILLYKASHVPVGDDQLRHIELTRHLAKAFNRKFGYLFPQPVPVTCDQKRILSFRDPTKKMSKSDADPKSRIDLLDPPDTIRSKLKKAVTDFTSEVSYDPENRPGVSNMIDIHCAFLDLFPEDIEEDPKIMVLDTLHYKLHLAEVIIECLKPIQSEMQRLQKDPAHLDSILKDGNDRAREIASETLTMARKQMGLL